MGSNLFAALIVSDLVSGRNGSISACNQISLKEVPPMKRNLFEFVVGVTVSAVLVYFFFWILPSWKIGFIAGFESAVEKIVAPIR